VSIKQLAARARAENVLQTVLLELTYKCNLDCFYCYNDRGIEGTPLSKEQYFALFEELREMQVFNLVLSGGEPLAHPDFFELGAKARELGFVIRLKSNGHALNHRLAKRVKEEVDPFNIDISLHGATAATHDRQTQVEGSFDKLINNLRTLRSLGIRYKLNATVTRWNEHEIEEMFALAEDCGGMSMSTSVTPRDDGDTTPLTIAPTSAAIRRVHSVLLAKEESVRGPAKRLEKAADRACSNDREGKKLCGTGSTTLTIDPVGNILPCVQWRRPLGNIHRDSLRSLWQQSADLALVRETSAKAAEFVENLGEHGALSSYCIGEAVNQTGKPIGMYPIAKRNFENRLKIEIKT
jgi:MoaA/NifB/PqqE/SkfB family radical SAM enzyme